MRWVFLVLSVISGFACLFQLLYSGPDKTAFIELCVALCSWILGAFGGGPKDPRVKDVPWQTYYHVSKSNF